ncbi:unnamed protein product [Adineta steineri]|uniref:Acireductone dioxygenase n=2 Tax=Adineta steineri TaxID=433720 RepID=A0A819E7X5_9BILA|nr:unnamed protein product [Adineta steineri]CAF1366384.1 unnamed protein product [Adineta steineri]CAF3560627.1 unnamed protein product [Adineta steineri]CAF3846041.1 unnamed protein product [Adineta steineri]
MVQSWYMNDGTEHSQDEHLLEEIDTTTLCARTGVEIWYFHPDQILVEHENLSLTKLKHDRGYTYEDEIKIESSMENYEENLKIFFTEHLHSDDEIRLILEGSGFFDVRDCDDKWIRIHVFPGDLIILPAGIYHRFIPDKQNYIRARRFFVGEPVWTPINRPDGDKHPSRKIYIEHRYRNGKVNTEKNLTNAAS